MDGITAQLVLIAALVAVNAVLSGTEVALLTLREGQLDRIENRSATGRVLASLARDTVRFLATIQVGITLAGFAASAAAAVALSERTAELLTFAGDYAEPAAVALVTVAIAVVSLVFGELVPKRLAMQHAERWGLLAARPLSMFAVAVRPVVAALTVATNVTVRLLGGDPHADREQVTDEEIRHLVATEGLYTAGQHQIITGALEVADRTVRQILVPRGDVVALQDSTPVDEGLATLAAAGRSRAPVYAASIDDADRVVSVLSLVGKSGPVADHARPLIALPEGATALDALRQMQSGHHVMALVVSEYGGVEGIVTIEDLVEELVGEIYDEHDRDIQHVVRFPNGHLALPGRFPVHDLIDLGIEVEDVDAATVGGLISELLGRMAERGDAVRVGGHLLTVVAVEGRAVARVRVQPDPDVDGAPAG